MVLNQSFVGEKMPEVIDPETMNIDELPGIWSPVQWELSPEERLAEAEAQAQSSLLANIDVPEAILRLLLNEYAIGRAYTSPEGYDPEVQGEWDENILTYAFTKPVTLEQVERNRDRLVVIYQFANLGKWMIEVQPERVVIERI